jgi:hypothetical protein
LEAGIGLLYDLMVREDGVAKGQTLRICLLDLVSAGSTQS